LTKTPLIYTVSSFNIFGLETLFGELSSPNPRRDGTVDAVETFLNELW